MMVLATRELSLEQFLALPERTPPLEYEEGIVTPKVSPTTRHSILQGHVLQLLRDAGRGIVYVFPELRVTFAGRSLVPDVAVFRRERAPIAADGSWIDDVLVPPDLAVEVLSPRQAITRTVRRCVWYVQNGVAIALLVDPDDRTVLVFRVGAPTLAARGADAIDVTDVVPGLAPTADEVFAALRA
jgi:Uma2 family endonuclease